MSQLFRMGEFALHSGAQSRFKIDCDALGAREIDALAAMLAEILPPFAWVEGIPTGGMRLAAAMARHGQPGNRLLIVDDVCTTGASLERQRRGRDAIGAVLFARGPVPEWVTPLFVLDGRVR